jgi:hypothetical protein
MRQAAEMTTPLRRIGSIYLFLGKEVEEPEPRVTTDLSLGGFRFLWSASTTSKIEVDSIRSRKAC